MTFWCGSWGQFTPKLSPPPLFFFFLLNFTRILLFSVDLGLMLFDIPQDVVFAEILVFSIIFGFPVVNWAPKWTKTIKFECVPFKQKYKIFNDFPNILFVLSDTLVKVSAKSNNIWVQKMVHFMDAELILKTSKIFNFITAGAAILMKLTTNMYHNKVFYLPKSSGVTPRVRERLIKNLSK